MCEYWGENIGKIVSYEQGVGVEMRGTWPCTVDGVYVLIRTNGTFGDELWNNMACIFSRFAARMNRNDYIAAAPNHEERFAYFPVMAGEHLGEIAEFITALMQKGKALGTARLAAFGAAHSPNEGESFTQKRFSVFRE